MSRKKKLLRKKTSIYKGDIGNGMTFIVILILIVGTVAFQLIGGQLPKLDNNNLGNPVVIVTSAPGAAKGNLQIYTFLGLTVTPAPTQIPTIFPGNPLPPSNIPPSPGTPTNTPIPPSPTLTCTHYVAKNGNDNNPGTETQPWLTITKSAKTAAAGNTVCVKQGTYNERLIPRNSGISGNYITFAAYPGDNVTIDGSGISIGDWYGLVNILGKGYIKISGFRIINSDAAGVFVSKDDSSNSPSNHINIENNYIYNSRSSGIQALGQSSTPATNYVINGNNIVKSQYNGQINHETITVTENVNGFTISNNNINGSKTEGIDVKNNVWNGEIYGNDVSSTNNVGIYIDAWSTNTGNIKIYNNRVHNQTPNNVDSDATGIMLGSEQGGTLTNISVYNNLVYNNPGDGINIGWYSKAPIENIKIVSNTVYNNGGGIGWTTGGIQLNYAGMTNILVQNNIVSQNNGFQIRTTVPAQTIITNNLTYGFRNYSSETRGQNYVDADPKFVNPSSSDFHLQISSPAINKGTSTNTPSTDFDGNTRPKGAGYDIGAYEL